MPLPESSQTAEAAPAAVFHNPTDFNPLDAIRIVRSAGGALLTQASLHAQLAQVEWAEEKRRVLTMYWVAQLGLAGLLCVLLFAGVLVLAIGWQTPYRVPSVVVLIAAYAAATALAWRRFQALAAQGDRSFAATRAEIAADLALLKSKL